MLSDRMEGLEVYDGRIEQEGRGLVAVSHAGHTSSGGGGLDFGIVGLAEAARGVRLGLTVRLEDHRADVWICSVELASMASGMPFRVISQGHGRPRALHYGEDLTVWVGAHTCAIGQYYDRVDITFEDARSCVRFVVARAVHLVVGPSVDHARAAYVFQSRPLLAQGMEHGDEGGRVEMGMRNVVSALAPSVSRTTAYSASSADAHIPQHILDVLEGSRTSSTMHRFRRSVLPQMLDSSTHALYFKVLLWVEEYHMKQNLQIYDIQSTTLTMQGPNHFHLSVPGLVEKRPNVIIGDIILVQPHTGPADHWFDGRVQLVHGEEVGVYFDQSFRAYFGPDKLFRVRFTLNRRVLRRMHQALDVVDAAFQVDRVLFPGWRDVAQGRVGSADTIRPFLYDPTIANNEAQLQAVATVVEMPLGAAPFVIFGPPGTGKTVTIVEAIRQVLRKHPHFRILACAPSNSAADLIAQRLRVLTREQLFRFYAPSRPKAAVPADLLPYTRLDQEHNFVAPPLEELKQFRVVVCTCASASFASSIVMPRGHFSHIFVDEAAQASEPEVMIAIKTIADDWTNVVLSGDPKQLGPVIVSPIARSFGLERSFLQRLMDLKMYDEKKGSSLAMVKLGQNFRSHPDILSFPNKMFYGGGLRPCGTPQTINAYLGCSLLPNKGFPVMFYGVSGKDDREGLSPSFFNADEASLVKTMVISLLTDRQLRCLDTDIGVITPYHAQVVKIRSLLRVATDGIKVGSVEEFQGQERPVIIISTVRSSRNFIKYDLKHTLGFVASPRRFNVAVTRAKALLIVIGDPKVLSLDPMWRSFLNYIHQRGGWEGEAPGWDTSAPVDPNTSFVEEIRRAGDMNMSDFAARMETLTLDGLGEHGAGEMSENEDIGEEDANVPRAWSEVEEISLRIR